MTWYRKLPRQLDSSKVEFSKFLLPQTTGSSPPSASCRRSCADCHSSLSSAFMPHKSEAAMATVPRLPVVVVNRVRNVVLAADFRNLLAGIGLLKDRNDPCFVESGPFRLSLRTVSFRRKTPLATYRSGGRSLRYDGARQRSYCIV